MFLLRSVKNWLTLLVVGLVALSMLVAWLYVVPPLGSRLERQKLADMYGNADLTSATVGEFSRFDGSTGDLEVDDPLALDQVIGRIAMRLNARVIVLTRDKVAVADSGGDDPFAAGDFSMLDATMDRRPTPSPAPSSCWPRSTTSTKRWPASRASCSWPPRWRCW
jgi:hypothetical protein